MRGCAWRSQNYRSEVACACEPSLPPGFFGTAKRTQIVKSAAMAASERIFVMNVCVMAILLGSPFASERTVKTKVPDGSNKFFARQRATTALLQSSTSRTEYCPATRYFFRAREPCELRLSGITFAVSPALLRNASFKLAGRPCFFSRSLNASSASS